MQDLPYFIAFTRITHIGPKRFQQLIAYFTTAERAWNAPSHELKKSGLDARASDALITERVHINPAHEYEQCVKNNVSIVTLYDEQYPPLLKEIYDPPFILFYRGTLPAHTRPLAIVGTRHATSYGKQVIDTLVPDICAHRIPIISGLALGIDSLVHHKTVNARGIAVAVLGCGIEQNNIYPRANERLAEHIINTNGAVISEHPPGTPPLKPHFPRRNRIISGISFATLVIEAPEKSGALLTAHYALEQNREVYAIPGNITQPSSAGTNILIKNGAQPIHSAQDIITQFGMQSSTKQALPIEGKNEIEKAILAQLQTAPCSMDILIRSLAYPPHEIHATLTIMEMNGMVSRISGMQYART